MTPQEIKSLRQSLNLSQTKFGALIGVALRTIQDYEAGKRNPGGSAVLMMKSLAARLGDCPSCHRPNHKFHNCEINPVAEP